MAAAVPRVRRLCGARGRGADALRGPAGAGPAGPRTPADPPAARYAYRLSRTPHPQSDLNARRYFSPSSLSIMCSILRALPHV